MIGYHALIRPSLSLSPYSYRAFAASPNKVVIPSDRRRRRVVRWPLPRSSAPRQRFADRTARRTPALLLSSRLPPLPPLISQIPFFSFPFVPFPPTSLPSPFIPASYDWTTAWTRSKGRALPIFSPLLLISSRDSTRFPLFPFFPLHFYIIL